MAYFVKAWHSFPWQEQNLCTEWRKVEQGRHNLESIPLMGTNLCHYYSYKFVFEDMSLHCLVWDPTPKCSRRQHCVASMREEDPKILETLCPKKEKGLGQDEHYLQGKGEWGWVEKVWKKRKIGGHPFGCKLINNFKIRM